MIFREVHEVYHKKNTHRKSSACQWGVILFFSFFEG